MEIFLLVLNLITIIVSAVSIALCIHISNETKD